MSAESAAGGAVRSTRAAGRTSPAVATREPGPATTVQDADADALLDSEILRFLDSYGAAAIPVQRIARALSLQEDEARCIETRLARMAREGRVRRSRAFPDRWLLAGRR
jgi:hypothetical protein